MTNSKRFKLFVLIFFVLVVVSQGAVLKLEVLSHPSGSDIFIDNVWRGVTPLSVNVSPGKHVIKLEKNGYLTQQQELDAVLPYVLEYNLFPVKSISKEFPIVMYLVNYQESGDRRILFRENEEKLISTLESRFKNMGFTVNIEKPRDEFDLVMDSDSIFYTLSEKYPESKLIMFIDSSWSYSSYNQKKLTRLNTSTKIYDTKTSITLSNFQDVTESIGVMGDSIAVLEIVEKISQNFLDYIGNYMIQMRGKKIETPKLISYDEKSKVMTLKINDSVENIEYISEDGSAVDVKTTEIAGYPINILFLIDRSGSNVDLLENIKDQIEKIILSLPDNAEWGLMGFDDKIELIQNFTSDFGKWEFSKSRIYASGMTRLYDGFYNAANLLSRRKGVKVAILLSDGIDADYYDTGFGSVKTEDEAVNFMKDSGIILYPLGIANKNFDNFLKELAEQFNTQYFNSFKDDNDTIAKSLVKNLIFTTYFAELEANSGMVLKINGKEYHLSENMRDFLTDKSETAAEYEENIVAEKKTELIDNSSANSDESKILNSFETDIEEIPEINDTDKGIYSDVSNLEQLNTDTESTDDEARESETVNGETTDIGTVLPEKEFFEDKETPEDKSDLSSDKTSESSMSVPDKKDEGIKDEKTAEQDKISDDVALIGSVSNPIDEVTPPDKKPSTDMGKEDSLTDTKTENKNSIDEADDTEADDKTVESNDKASDSQVSEPEVPDTDNRGETDNLTSNEDNSKNPEKQDTISYFPKDMEYPESFEEIYRTENTQVFDVDKKGNFLWNENGYAYIWEIEKEKIVGFDTGMNSGNSVLFMEYPFVVGYDEQVLRIFQITEKEVRIECELPVKSPVSSAAILEYMFISVGFADGNAEIYSFTGEKIHEFKTLTGKINKMCFDDQNRLIYSTSSNAVGWVDLNTKDSPTEIKYTKPIISLFPFNVDKSRFLVIDASGIVHYQRFSNLKPTSRNLNRGIVLLSEVSEDSNLLFAVHWDKKMRAYRLYDLEEMFSITPESNIVNFDVSSSSNVVAVKTADGILHLLAEDSEFPSTVEFLAVSGIPEVKKETAETDEQKTNADVPDTTESEIGSKDQINGEEETKTDSVKEPEFDVEGAESVKFVNAVPEVKKEEEKEEEIVVVMGNEPPPESNTSKDADMIMQELYSQEEKTGFVPVYGDWTIGIPYKDFGYLLAGKDRVVMTNSLLEKRFDFDITSGNIIDMDISKYGLLVILCERGVEIWDFEPMLRNAPSLWKKGIKYPVTNATLARFSRNGEKILLNQSGGQFTVIDSNLSQSRNYIHEHEISSIAADLSEAERFIFGDSSGQIGFIEDGKTVVKEKVSSSPITSVFWLKDRVFWADSVGNIGEMGGSTVKISEKGITAVYASDIEKEWIMLGTDTGNMIIVNSSLKKIGEASIGDKAVKNLRGYKENMLSVDSFSNIKSWNLNAGAVIGKKPKFNENTWLFSDNGIMYVLQKNGDFYKYDIESESVFANKIFNKQMDIAGLIKKPVVFNIDGLRYFPFLEGKLVEKALKIYEEGNVSVSGKYMMFWKNDILQIYDMKEEKTLRTFKFGEGNVVNYATMQNERLFFFFNNSFAIVNPFNPGEAVVVDISELKNDKLISAFVYNNKLGFVDSKGMVYYYNILENKIGITIELAKSMNKAYYNSEAIKLIGFTGNTVVIYSPVDNNIENLVVSSEIVDLDWIGSRLYVLCKDGVIYEKDI